MRKATRSATRSRVLAAFWPVASTAAFLASAFPASADRQYQRCGNVAAGILGLVGAGTYLFEFTSLTAGVDRQPLIVAFYYSIFAAVVRAQQSVDAMAVIWMVTRGPVFSSRCVLSVLHN